MNSFQSVPKSKSKRNEMKLQCVCCVLLLLVISVEAVAVPKWCVTSVASLAQCQAVQAKLNNSLSCIRGLDEKDCYKKINMKSADIGVFDGGMIYQAGKEHNLKAIMAEKLKSGLGSSTAYFAVAAVKASSGITLATLKGKRSCHTGVGKTSGWLIPLGTLLGKSYMSCVNHNLFASVAGFFNGSCAPGANNVKYNPKKTEEAKLCSLCSGSGNKKCARNSDEPYYSYTGALKCLTDGAGDVAFIKQATLMDLPVADQAKYKILCLDGTTAAPQQFSSCNLARVPTHAVLTRSDAPIADYQKVLADADKILGAGTSSSVKLYNQGLLFSKNTIGLQPIIPANQQYSKYLDTAYLSDVKQMEKCGGVTGKANALEYSLLLVFMVSAFSWILL